MKKHLITKILLCIFSVALVGVTLFFDEKLSASAPGSQIKEIEIIDKGSDAVFQKTGDQYLLEAGNQAHLILVIANNSVLRLEKGTNALLTLSAFGNFPRQANINLKQGRIWLNSLYSNLATQINTEVVQLSAEPGIFDIKYHNGTLDVTAFRRSIQVSFLGNRLIVPEARQISIAEAKIKNASETISKLRYSKLLKEFPYFAAEKPDEWTLKNQQDDKIFLEAYKKKLFDEIQEDGSVLGLDESSMFFKFGSLMKNAGVIFTFDEEKKEKKKIALISDYIDDAAYATVIGKLDLANRRLGQFESFVAQLDNNIKNYSGWQNALALKADRFAFVQPQDDLFEVKIVLRQLTGEPSIPLLQAAFNDVLDIAAAGTDQETEQKTVTALRKFATVVSGTLNKISDFRLAEDIFFASVILNDFLSRNTDLLREEFLKTAELFEKTYLALIENKEQADDQRQFFISEKLKSIATLKSLIEKGNIPFQDGRKSILLIASQIEALQPTFSDKAVLAYFQEQLNSLKPFIAFLRSQDASRVHGSFQESFGEFVERIDEYKKITELLLGAEGGVNISASRREELAGIVAADFTQLEITDVQILLPDDEDEARVKVINAKFEGKKMLATYDTSRKVFSNIIFGSEKIPHAIKLENLKKFLLIKLGKLDLPKGQTAEDLTEAASGQSLLEKVAKVAILEALQKVNISVDEKYLGFENLNEGVVHVRLATIGEGVDAKVFAFDVLQKGSVVTNLKVQTVNGEIPVNGAFGLKELSVKVEQIYQKAIFEKQKEEELKKFTEGSAGPDLEPLPE